MARTPATSLFPITNDLFSTIYYTGSLRNRQLFFRGRRAAIARLGTDILQILVES